MAEETKTESKQVHLDLNKNIKCAESVKYKKTEKPDGGWGWMVVLGVAMSNMTTQATISVFGLLFSERFSDLGIGTGGAAIILSVQTTVLNLSGFFTGPIIKKYSYRKTCAAGAAFVTIGFFLTVLADSLSTFLITYSLFTGLGLGLLYPSTFVAINSYFSGRRGIAVGISVAGTGMGQMWLPLLIRFLLDEYGYRGTIFILASISAHGIVGAILYQPVKWHLKGKKTDHESKKKGESVFQERFRRFSEPRCLSTSSIDTVVMDVKEESLPGPIPCSKSTETKEKEHPVPLSVALPSAAAAATPVEGKADPKDKSRSPGLWAKIVEVMDWDLLKSPSFLNLVTGLGMVYTANQTFQMLFPFYILSLGYNRSNVADCMSVMSGADIIGRLMLPYLATTCCKITYRTQFFLGALISAVLRSALMREDDLLIIMILAAGCGFIRSAIVVNFNLSISENAPPEKLPAALGLHMVFKGACIMTFGPLIGYVRDLTASYPLSVHIADLCFLVLPFITWFLEVVIVKLTKR